MRVNNKFAQIPRKINVPDKPRGKLIIECDELWSFVDNKDNEYWVWLAIDRKRARNCWLLCGRSITRIGEKIMEVTTSCVSTM